MTNQELRDLVQTWKLTDECPYPGATEAIIRLLDEHQLMAEALFVIANNGVHLRENPTSHCDYAREILDQCKGVVIT